MHKCEVCGKAFLRKSDLDNHLDIHSGRQPYKSEVCDKSFLHKSDLNNHFEKHTENNYPTHHTSIKFVVNHEDIKAAYAHKNTLEEHITKCSEIQVHNYNNEWYKCKICESLFKTFQQLKIHLSIQHKMSNL